MFSLRHSFNFYCGILIKRAFNTSNESIITHKEMDILVIKLNRPEKRNCINAEMANLLKKTLKEFDQDDNLKCAILHGEGGNFSSGYDLSEISKNNEAIIKVPLGLNHMLTKKPLIAAVDGYAVACGFELALLCDFVLCDQDSLFGVYNRRFGIPLIDGGTIRLPKIVGLSRALNIILTGRTINAQEAKQIGIVYNVTAVGAVLGAAFNLAVMINKFPQQCLLADRKSIYYSVFEAKSMEDALEYETRNGLPIIKAEGMEGAKKFIESGLGRHGKTNLDSLDTILNRNRPDVF